MSYYPMYYIKNYYSDISYFSTSNFKYYNLYFSTSKNVWIKFYPNILGS